MQHSMKRFITIKQQAHTIVPVYTLYGMLWSLYAFQSIEKSVMKGRIKESPWRSQKIVFRTTVLSIRHNNLLFCVIFRVLHLVQPGLMAGWLGGDRPNRGDFQIF